jgi:hypothetical protein
VLPAVEDAVRAMIGNREALQQLELSEYARFLRGEEMEGTAPLPEDERRELELQLEFIRQALIDPFTDPRPPICDGTPELPLGGGLTDQYGVALLPTFPELLSGDALFEQLTGETRESLASTRAAAAALPPRARARRVRPLARALLRSSNRLRAAHSRPARPSLPSTALGARAGGLLVAKAIRTGSRERVPGMWCSLESGMQAFLPAEAMTDVPREMAPEEYPIVAGQTFHCAVLSPSDVDTLKFECVVSCRPDDLARADFRSVAEQRAHNERPTGPKVRARARRLLPSAACVLACRPLGCSALRGACTAPASALCPSHPLVRAHSPSRASLAAAACLHPRAAAQASNHAPALPECALREGGRDPQAGCARTAALPPRCRQQPQPCLPPSHTHRRARTHTRARAHACCPRACLRAPPPHHRSHTH